MLASLSSKLMVRRSWKKQECVVVSGGWLEEHTGPLVHLDQCSWGPVCPSKDGNGMLLQLVSLCRLMGEHTRYRELEWEEYMLPFQKAGPDWLLHIPVLDSSMKDSQSPVYSRSLVNKHCWLSDLVSAKPMDSENRLAPCCCCLGCRVIGLCGSDRWAASGCWVEALHRGGRGKG